MSRLPWMSVALLLAASSALAQQPYRRSVVAGRPLCLAWNERAYVYHYEPSGSARTPGDTEFAAMEAAFDTWRALSASCSDYAFVRGADMSGALAQYLNPKDFSQGVNENVILFREVSCPDVVPEGDPCWDDKACGNAYKCWDHGAAVIGLTTSSYWSSSGHVLDADIELNGSRPGGSDGFLFTTVSSPPCEPGLSSPACVAVDLQNTLTHEIGHVLGLDHVITPGSTMESTAPPGETQKRILDAGSAEGFCTIYPRGLPPTQCLEPVGKGQALTAEGRLGCATTAPLSLLPTLLLTAGALRRRRRR